MKNSFCKIKSPLGEIILVADDKNLLAVQLPHPDKKNRAASRMAEAAEEHPILKKAAKQLTEYFAGRRKTFDLPLKIGGTEFQNKVWQGLCEIPFGKTASYQDLAVAVGSPKAVRAAGMANSRNPLAIVVPCHRVIGKNGTLTGFAAGLKAKEFLLKHEGARSVLF
jgi:methylated-DNA-[protein]-cysteine S-methyltransferase